MFAQKFPLPSFTSDRNLRIREERNGAGREERQARPRDWSNADPAFLLAGNSILQLNWLFACFSHGRLLNRFRVTVTSYRFFPHVASFIFHCLFLLPSILTVGYIFLVGLRLSWLFSFSPRNVNTAYNRISVLSESYDCRWTSEPQTRTLPKEKERKLRQRIEVPGKRDYFRATMWSYFICFGGKTRASHGSYYFKKSMALT